MQVYSKPGWETGGGDHPSEGSRSSAVGAPQYGHQVDMGRPKLDSVGRGHVDC